MLWIAAGRGNEEFVERFIDANYQKYVLASTTISGYLIRPELDADGNIVGSQIDYCSSVDLAGNLPRSLIKSRLPQSAVDAIEGLVSFASKQNK